MRDHPEQRTTAWNCNEARAHWVQEVVDVADRRPRCQRLHYNVAVDFLYSRGPAVVCKACGSRYVFGGDVGRVRAYLTQVVKETILRRRRPS